MDGKDIFIIVCFMVGFFISGVGAGGQFMHAFVDDTWRDIIANKGCAEYYLDEKHQRQWRWKDGTPKN